ncbi:MAG: type II toxin-antitoxin system RelE family toxin [Aminivibrio sp.]|jgi:mRNA interferase RelE/StbE
MVSSWKVLISREAKKRLEKIPQPDRRRILTAIDALHTGPLGDIKRLKGRNEWRLRVGDRRVLLEIDETDFAIRILSIGSRGDVYK